jgi:5-methylcytosine-specific restriction endonuclease McrA
MNDLSGKKFGKWTVCEYTHHYGGHDYWRCKCDCGTVKIVDGISLLRGGSKNCGCWRKSDLTGRRFGMWMVVGSAPNDKGKVCWRCKCDCGTERVVRAETLKSTSRDCGCVERQQRDIRGKKFGRWTILSFSHISSDKRHRRFWKCRCDCGVEKTIVEDSLKNGISQSCGCLQKEKVSLPKGEAAMRGVFRTYMYMAQKRGYVFELTLKEFHAITSSNCHYCGSPPIQDTKRKRTNGNYLYNGVDRIDNKKGYILSNCVPCCGKCNTAKSDMPEQEFIDWVEKLCKHYYLPLSNQGQSFARNQIKTRSRAKADKARMATQQYTTSMCISRC